MCNTKAVTFSIVDLNAIFNSTLILAEEQIQVRQDFNILWIDVSFLDMLVIAVNTNTAVFQDLYAIYFDFIVEKIETSQVFIY